MFKFSLFSKHLSRSRDWWLAVFLAVAGAATWAAPAWAWDLWLVTSHHRILVIHDMPHAPAQTVRLTHPAVSDAYEGAFGDIAFAPNGRLYGISLTLGAPAALYTIDTNTGSIAKVGEFPFEWGNAIYFDPQTGRGYVGGGLEHWQPYELLHGFYVFNPYDPATTYLWHDMRTDFPNGGFTGGYTYDHSHLYALWGQGHMYAHTTYLLRITEDAAGNFVSYDNLGDLESHGIPEGGWNLVSDGQTLYVVSPSTLYAVDPRTNPATYTKVLDFDLENDETVNGGTIPWADLQLAFSPDSAEITIGHASSHTLTLHNAGPLPAERVAIQVALPEAYHLEQALPGAGAFDPASGMWTVDVIAPGQTFTLVPRGTPDTTGVFSLQASLLNTSMLDTLLANNTTTAQLTVIPRQLPAAGFAPGMALGLPREAKASQAGLGVHLTIPSLGVSAAVMGVPLGRNGWDVTWLGQSVGWLEGSAFPSRRGNTVLVGHVWNADNLPGVFYNLQRLRYGDRLYLQVGDARRTYAVTENRLLAPGEVRRAFSHTKKDVLTLLTCAGYMPATGGYASRRMIRAVPIINFFTP